MPACPARLRLLSGSCSSARSFAPRFLHAGLTERRSAVCFARCDQLAGGLPPPSRCPCWAHTTERCLSKVTTQLLENREPSVADAFGTIEALRHIAVAPEASRAILVAPAWMHDLAFLEKAIDEGEHLTALISEMEGHFRPEAWTCDTAALLLILRADGSSFFRRLSGRYRQAIADLRAICRTKPPKTLKDRITLLEAFQKAQESRREFSKKMTILSSALGLLWAEFKTPWKDARALAVS